MCKKIKLTRDIKSSSKSKTQASGGKNKKINQFILVEASTVKEAYDNLADNMSNLMVDYKVISVAESPIVEVFYPNETTKKIEPKEVSSGTGMVPNTDFNRSCLLQDVGWDLGFFRRRPMSLEYQKEIFNKKIYCKIS